MHSSNAPSRAQQTRSAKERDGSKQPKTSHGRVDDLAGVLRGFGAEPGTRGLFTEIHRRADRYIQQSSWRSRGTGVRRLLVATVEKPTTGREKAC